MNTLLITGATGFLGGAVLESILNKKNAPNLLLLVRADNSVAAVERVKENLRKFNISEERLTALTPGNILLGSGQSAALSRRPAPESGYPRAQLRRRRLIW